VRPRAAALLAGAALAAGAPGAVAPASASAATPVRFERIRGVASPGTPARLDRVGILEVGRRDAPNILVLEPGTSAGAAYFAPLARTIVARAKGWQVWAVERRENLLEDQSMLDRAKAGTATPRQVFDYYLGYLADPAAPRRPSPTGHRVQRQTVGNAAPSRAETATPRTVLRHPGADHRIAALRSSLAEGLHRAGRVRTTGL
jgi:hypothetical protein